MGACSAKNREKMEEDAYISRGGESSCSLHGRVWEGTLSDGSWDLSGCRPGAPTLSFLLVLSEYYFLVPTAEDSDLVLLGWCGSREFCWSSFLFLFFNWRRSLALSMKLGSNLCSSWISFLCAGITAHATTHC